jgi:hypothetical protein
MFTNSWLMIVSRQLGREGDALFRHEGSLLFQRVFPTVVGIFPKRTLIHAGKLLPATPSVSLHWWPSPWLTCLWNLDHHDERLEMVIFRTWRKARMGFTYARPAKSPYSNNRASGTAGALQSST